MSNGANSADADAAFNLNTQKYTMMYAQSDNNMSLLFNSSTNYFSSIQAIIFNTELQ